jgi:hypothetical protein
MLKTFAAGSRQRSPKLFSKCHRNFFLCFYFVEKNRKKLNRLEPNQQLPTAILTKTTSTITSTLTTTTTTT